MPRLLRLSKVYAFGAWRRKKVGISKSSFGPWGERPAVSRRYVSDPGHALNPCARGEPFGPPRVGFSPSPCVALSPPRRGLSPRAPPSFHCCLFHYFVLPSLSLGKPTAYLFLGNQYCCAIIIPNLRQHFLLPGLPIVYDRSPGGPSTSSGGRPPFWFTSL